MPIDVETPETPGWWLQRLSRQMHARPATGDLRLTRAERLDLLWSYRTGNPPLPKATEMHSRFTREFLRMARANYAALVVQAMLERLRFQGVQTGPDEDADGDDLARRIATANGWGALSQDLLDYMLSMSEGYVIVGEPDAVGNPLITAQDPRQVITAHDPARPLVTRAALNIYRDDDMGFDMAHVYTPGRVDVAVRSVGSVAQTSRFSARTWEWAEELSGPLPIEGGEDIVPVVRFRNRLGMGEYEPHLDVLNRINEMISDRLWIAKFQTFRQRAVKGDLPSHDDHGQEIDYDQVFEADPGAFWQLPDGVDLWESQTTDLTPVLLAVRDDTKELAAVTRTPLHYLTPDAANGSAEGASMMREGLVFKVEDCQARITPGMLAVWRYAFLFAGDAERANGELTPMWGPAERFSLSERGDAATKGKASGVPIRSILSDLWQFDPATVARMERERAGDLLFQQPGDPTPTATPGATVPPVTPPTTVPGG